MRDTSPEAAARYRELLQSCTPARRLEMAFDMFDFARDLVRAAIRSANPEATKAEVEQELFRRFYGRDFTPEQQRYVLGHIARLHADD